MAYSVVTTVLSPAASRDLTDLETVKDELSIDEDDTSDDAWLGRAIRQVSRAIERHLKRPLVPEQVQDIFDIQQDPYPAQTPGGFPTLDLTRWPIMQLTSVVQTIALNTFQTLVAGTDFRADPKTGQLQRLNPFTGVATIWEAIPVTVVYTAGYGALVPAEPHSVPATGPYTVTVAGAETFSCDLGVAYETGVALTPVAANPTQGQYAVAIATGVYTFAAADAAQAVTIAYANIGIPDDMIEICLRLITARYKSKDRDPNLVQRDTPGVGTERWWFGGAPGQKGAFAPDIEAALEEYRVPTVA